mgnify:CR=1 FL=1
MCELQVKRESTQRLLAQVIYQPQNARANSEGHDGKDRDGKDHESENHNSRNHESKNHEFAFKLIPLEGDVTEPEITHSHFITP